MTERVIATIQLPFQTESGMSHISGLTLEVKRWLVNGSVMVVTPKNPYSGWVILKFGEYQYA